ncbi:hypothetical protein ACOBR2_00795 [Telmatobacter bradus]|uniref:hypothetical protein n=1 Tax=Telmatobacter bradus TaxID=474953 RepID=UPI003B43D621
MQNTPPVNTDSEDAAAWQGQRLHGCIAAFVGRHSRCGVPHFLCLKKRRTVHKFLSNLDSDAGIVLFQFGSEVF